MIFPVHWHRIEARGLQNSGLRHAWLTGIIRYWIAVEIFNYGFAKILGTQFAPSYFKNDSTWSSLSGLDLTWNYFSYSYAMAGTYLYERDKRTIKFELSSHTSAANTLYASVTMLTPGHMKWKLIRQKDTAFLLLTKIPVDIHR